MRIDVIKKTAAFINKTMENKDGIERYQRWKEQAVETFSRQYDFTNDERALLEQHTS